jgi:hypothetical protein
MLSFAPNPGGVVGRAEAGPAAKLRLGGQGDGHLVHHRPGRLDLHQGPSRGGGFQGVGSLSEWDSGLADQEAQLPDCCGGLFQPI